MVIPAEETDVLVVGSGIAGLYTALRCRDAGRVVVLTKGEVEEGSTPHAQGGIAAAVAADDSPERHLQDTLAAGDGLCDEPAVRVLVEEGPACVEDLIELGVRFDTDAGGFALTREGAHSRSRVLHARGDATGAEIAAALAERAAAERVDVRTQHTLVDLWIDGGRCAGALALDPAGEVRAFRAAAVILATGGAGQVYASTTNPPVATGDGIAAAYRAGATVMDMEFVQFHPTALYAEGSPKFLISEAVRGEGAVLLNARQERFMPSYHPLAELAPRDVVARAIFAEMRRSGAAHAWLDARGVPRAAARFPHIAAACRERGIDIESNLIPVAPAAHYLMGGVRTDLHGRTNIPGLYACGEVACTGAHGANRLASNSLLEGLVFGRRIAADIRRATGGRPSATARAAAGPASAIATASALPPESLPRLRAGIQAAMWEHAGVVRDHRGLLAAARRLEGILPPQPTSPRGQALPAPMRRAALEVVNLATVADLICRAALAREESRGAHYRADFPRRDDARWRRHVVASPEGRGSG